MKQSEILDNLTGQEIKELIAKGNVLMEQLSDSDLELLFLYESDAVCRGTGDEFFLRNLAKYMAEREGAVDAIDTAYQKSVFKASQAVKCANVRSESCVVLRNTFRWRKVALIAVATILLMCCATTAATALGFNVFDYFRKLIACEEGTTVESEFVTLVHNGEAMEYSSMRDLIRDQKLAIMYPGKLPDGVKISEIRIVKDSDGRSLIEMQTTDCNLYIHIELSKYGTSGTYADCEIHHIDGKVFYVQKQDSFASCFYNDNYYYIKAKTYTDLLLIIQNMKE